MENRQFTFTRLQGVETTQTAGTYGTSYTKVRLNAEKEVQQVVMLVEQQGKSDFDIYMEGVDAELQAISDRHHQAIAYKEFMDCVEVECYEEDVRNTRKLVRKYANPVLSKLFGKKLSKKGATEIAEMIIALKEEIERLEKRR